MHFARPWLLAALLVAAWCGTGCEPASGPDDGEITCANLDDFLYFCNPACVTSWHCEELYWDLPTRTQILLDDCSDCLSDNLDRQICADCEVPDGPYVWSCADILADELGIGCRWWY